MQDLLAGRIDMAILDPPLVQYAIIQHPEWKLKQVPVDPEPDKYPVMSTKYNVIFGINKNEPELAEAINAAIKDIWAECLNVKTMAKYGLCDKAWFVPPEKNPRDRRRPATPTTRHRPPIIASDAASELGRLDRMASSPRRLDDMSVERPGPAGRRRPAPPHCRPAQALRRARGLGRHQHRCLARRESLDHRPERFGQDDAAAMHQLSRKADVRGTSISTAS